MERESHSHSRTRNGKSEASIRLERPKWRKFWEQKWRQQLGRSVEDGEKQLSDGSSVTRLGEISPLWQKFTSLWQIFDCLFLIWLNAEPTLANLWHYWANLNCCKWPNVEKRSNDLVTLDGRNQTKNFLHYWFFILSTEGPYTLL